MKKYSAYISAFLVGLVLVLNSCQEDDYELGELIQPTNVNLTYLITGADDTHPNGDGSGIVTFTATADDAITFNYTFGDGKDSEISPGGEISHYFSINGVNTYDVTVYAIGTGGMSSSQTAQVEVLSSFKDDEAVQFLTGGSTKTWYFAADQLGHVGLGPNDQVYDGGDHTFAAWWSAGPFEKSSTSLYETSCVFTLDNGNLTFEQINPTGEAFIQGVYSEELGLGPEGSYTFDIAGVKNVSFSPSNTIATIDGGYHGTTMSFTDGGFMGWYAGTSEFEIIQVTDNILKVRQVQANTPLFAWYQIFTTVKPEQ